MYVDIGEVKETKPEKLLEIVTDLRCICMNTINNRWVTQLVEYAHIYMERERSRLFESVPGDYTYNSVILS